MSEFSRRGHYRTNANGASFWVRGHQVIREEYILSHVGADSFINGVRVIPNVTCKFCGSDVFYYENEHGSRVFFDSLGPPWPKHACYLGAENMGRAASGENRVEQRTKPYDAETLRRRQDELDKIRKERNERQERRKRREEARRQRRLKSVKNPKKRLSKKELKALASKANEMTPEEKERENLARARWQKWRENADVEVAVVRRKNIDKD